MLFVLGIYLLSGRARSVLWQVSAFTAAHSITLGLSLYGVVSMAENDAHALAIARDILAHLNRSKTLPVAVQAPSEPLYAAEEVYGIVPRDTRRPFDIREVIARLVDGSEFQEFKARYGKTLVCGFAHLHGENKAHGEFRVAGKLTEGKLNYEPGYYLHGRLCVFR